MAHALVQSQSASSAANYVNSLAITPTNSITAGSTLVALYTSSGGSDSINTQTVTDTNGNTWNKIQEIASSSRSASLWVAANVNPGAVTINLTDNSHYTERTGMVYEISGIDPATPVNVSLGQPESGYSDTHVISLTNTKQPGVLLAAFTGTSGSGTYTATGTNTPTLTTLPNDTAPGNFIYMEVNTIGTQTATLSAGGSAYEEMADVALIIVDPSAAPVVVKHNLMMMGLGS